MHLFGWHYYETKLSASSFIDLYLRLMPFFIHIEMALSGPLYTNSKDDIQRLVNDLEQIIDLVLELD